jgi:hypothetical protein
VGSAAKIAVGALEDRHLLAVEAVIGELVSAPHFPVSRENTGKFWCTRLVMAMRPSHYKQIQSVPSEFPKNRNREFRGLNSELRVA